MPAICRIITGVSGSPRNLPAVRYAAALAGSHAAALTLVLAWMPPCGEFLNHPFPSLDPRPEWEQAAWQRLHDAVNTALGEVPPEMNAELTVVCGEPGPVLVRTAGRAGDLLVVGTGRRGTAGRLTGRISRYCLARACCPVLAVPPAPLELEAAHALHRWAFRHRGPNLSELGADR